MTGYFTRIIPDPRQRRVILSVVAVIAVYGLTIGMFHPLISLNMEARGYSSTLIGITGMMPFVAAIFASPLAPLLMRSININKLIAICIFLDFLFALVLAFFDDVYLWMGIRFLMGVVGTFMFVASESWLAEIAEDHSRGQIMGIYTFTLSATFALAPIVVIIFGVHGPIPFIVAAIIIVSALLPLWGTRDANPDFSGGKVSQVFKFMVLAPTLTAAVALVSFEEAAFLTLMPVYAIYSGLSEAHSAFILTIIAVGSMVFQPLVGWLADQMNRHKLILLCTGISILGGLLVSVTITVQILAWPILFVWGGAVAGIYTVALTLLSQHFRGAQLAAGNAAFGIMWGVAGTSGPLAAGIAIDWWNPHGFIVVVTIAGLAFLILAGIRGASKR